MAIEGGGHPVEGIGQEPELVTARHGHPVRKLAGGKTASPFGERVERRHAPPDLNVGQDKHHRQGEKGHPPEARAEGGDRCQDRAGRLAQRNLPGGSSELVAQKHGPLPGEGPRRARITIAEIGREGVQWQPVGPPNAEAPAVGADGILSTDTPDPNRIESGEHDRGGVGGKSVSDDDRSGVGGEPRPCRPETDEVGGGNTHRFRRGAGHRVPGVGPIAEGEPANPGSVIWPNGEGLPWDHVATELDHDIPSPSEPVEHHDADALALSRQADERLPLEVDRDPAIAQQGEQPGWQGGAQEEQPDHAAGNFAPEVDVAPHSRLKTSGRGR